MAEYIDRESAIKAIYESDHFSVRECFGWSAREIEEVLRAIPAVDVAPVRHGRWKLYGNDDNLGSSYFCSKCGANYDEDYFYKRCKFIPFNFCPNCGARMTEDIDEQKK